MLARRAGPYGLGDTHRRAGTTSIALSLGQLPFPSNTGAGRGKAWARSFVSYASSGRVGEI